MRKGLSLSMIGGVTLALIGVAVMLGLFTNTFGGAFGDVFCSSYRSVGVLFPGDSPPPKGCGQDSRITYKEVEIASTDTFALRLGSAIVECWDKYKGYMTEEELCEGWNVKELESSVSESDVVSALEENGVCPSQIKHSSCNGASTDQIDITSDISAGDLIIVKYVTESGNQKIKVS